MPLPPLELELQALAQRHRLRSLTVLAGPSRTRPSLPDRTLRSFASNDYLGLAAHPEVLAAAQRAATEQGFGAGASRLVTGHLPAHHDLERVLAELVAAPAALLFPTGYQANLAVLTALANNEDLVVSDQLNHASIIDGCRLSRALVRIYPHADAAAARAALSSGSFRRRFLVTESLFSMDGDPAPLSELAAAAAHYDATLVIDEAHALGVLGPEGRGLCRAAGVTPDVLVGTLGKAFGSFGGFVAGPAVLRDFLINRARPFIFTTASPAPVAAAAQAAIALSLSAEGQARRARLLQSARELRSALSSLPLLRPLPPPGPIIPVTVGSDAAVLSLSHRLADAGFFVPAIRPPTVPEGSARLRITLSADHPPEDVAALASCLEASLS